VVQLPAWERIISKIYRLGLWLTQPPVHWAPGALPCGYSSQGVKLDPHLYVELKLGMDGSTVMCRLTTGIRSEKCVVMRFCHCVNVIECTYTNLDNIAHYTPSLYGIVFCS